MIITVAGYKGGIGKSTISVHVAAYLAKNADTLLVDGDANRSVLSWAKRGTLPFTVCDERAGIKHAREHTHVIFDTAARPGQEDLRALAEGCDLLILPTTPDAMSLDALMQIITELQGIGSTNFRALLSIIPPKPSRDGADARQMLAEAGFPLFESEIRRFVCYTKAALAGTPVYGIKDIHAQDAWDDFERLGKEILP